ncbi:substrate-binding domain-containing protein [Mesorhizobium sp. B3-1-9]|uniref:substrate-binding domain-containing protein n=1 Tax=unclassified Mesorhizobium TaxID=325217 RepID=UPI0011273BCD|nr:MULTISPECIES: substrate-binding domain-containing protein [unclassified Mesorhizobium]TPI40434.1 substrate-binding domain-containing protein [Mesorhizobium sp. B3-1-9]TPI63614.1 substrate-binding domain-containing protein [Mesorhizobium sp. B3-1-7]TPJ30044.1 substrate-binding domain-containing protein [Mesorhizobium sp. B2-8-3]UCI25678.1 substrate-binding domain-containing protein [Mesorhizobium sp. B2-8-5]
MGSMLKSTLIALGMTALASAVTAPARAQESSFGPADAKETYYWISNKANLPLFVQYDYVGMKKIAEELGVKVVVAGPTDFDLPGFIAAVDQVCAQKPNGVSVVGGWDPSLTESVKKCLEQGVPTVVDDGDLPDSGRLAYIGTNWTQVGVAQAKKIMEKLPSGGKLAMMSIINAGNMREAVAGFKAYIEANGGGKYNIVSNEDDGGDAQKAAQVTAAILAANPDIAGIAGFDSESGAGIVTALREAGKNPGDIKVTAMEQTPDFFKTAKQGWVDGIVVQNRELFIYYAVKILHDYNHNGLKSAGLGAADGGRPVPDTLDTGVLLVTKDNVDKVTAALGVK